MAKFDEQLSRMEYLMEYNTSGSKGASKIEYHTEGADGKVYGILREGTKYYIMTTEKGKENLAESYEYINGFRYRGENAFKSYNKATKILEEKMIALNEAYGVHKDVTTVDFNRSEKTFANLTEEARKELDRVKTIMENADKLGIKNNIGDHGDEESKGKALPSDTKKNNDPFSLDPESKDGGAKSYDASKGVEKTMTSDKAPKMNDTNELDNWKETKSDLDGEEVVSKKPSGGKAVMVNEGHSDDFLNLGDEYGYDNEYEIDDKAADAAVSDADDVFARYRAAMAKKNPIYKNDDDIVGVDDGNDDYEDEVIDTWGDDDNDDDIDVDIENDDDLDDLFEEFEYAQKPKTDHKKGHGKVQSYERIGGRVTAPETEEALLGPKGNGEHITWDKLNENQKRYVNRITESVYNRLTGKNKKKPTLREKIDRIVKEELNVWGKHPKYGQQPFNLPPNNEVMRGTAETDWNDESAKGDNRYGRRIGNGKPFSDDAEALVDAVVDMVKESVKKKNNRG